MSEAAFSEARRLIQLTERLTARLQDETEAFRTHRAHQVAAGMTETQDLANIYRRETARVKADRSLVSGASASDRLELVRVTQRFETVLAEHARVVDAARLVSEGLARTIAQEVAAARALGTGYGAQGQARAGDGRAISLNRTA